MKGLISIPFTELRLLEQDQAAAGRPWGENRLLKNKLPKAKAEMGNSLKNHTV